MSDASDRARDEGLEDLDALFRSYLNDGDGFLAFLQTVAVDPPRMLAAAYNAIWAMHCLAAGWASAAGLDGGEMAVATEVWAITLPKMRSARGPGG